MSEALKWQAGASIRQRGWIWRGGIPTEIEYEMGFAAEDGAPYVREVGGLPFVEVRPSSSPQGLIVARIHELENIIKMNARDTEHKQEEINRLRALRLP